MKIKDIKIRDRYRRDLGNLDRLCNSIKEIGLLHPVVVNEDDELVSGIRRIRAFEKLGHDEIPVNVINLKDLKKGERDENIVRKNFTPSEKVAIWQAMEKISPPGKKLNESLSNYRIDRAAEVLGTSRQTLTRAKEVVDYADKKNKPEIVEKMDETGNVSESYKEQTKLKKEDLRNKLALQGKDIKLTDSDIQLIHNDFMKANIEEDSVDLVLTDPPYGGEYLYLWDDLSEFANKVLKPSGFLVTYAGHMYLPEWINRLSKHLKYYWIFCLYHTGQIGVCLGRNMECQWKPILIFQKEPFKKLDKIVNDYLENDVRQKSLHGWQQGESGAGKLIEIFSKERDLICDPMMGSGTFPYMSHKLNRRTIGIEINQEDYWICKSRFKKE